MTQLYKELEPMSGAWAVEAQKRFYKSQQNPMEREFATVLDELEALRIDAGLTVAQFAEVIGEDRSQYYNLVHSEKTPRRTTLERLHVKLQKLLGGGENVRENHKRD